MFLPLGADWTSFAAFTALAFFAVIAFQSTIPLFTKG
jgi:hypothetical protein